ncbi:MAG TPA: polysaccharide biosynthesis/export family protein [Terriglobales bacterium]
MESCARRHRWLNGLLAAVILPAMIAPAQQTAPAAQTTHPDPAPRLAAGDMIEVTVYNVPDMSTKTRIGGSGDAYLPLIDYVHLDGLTAEEAQALIQNRLADGGFVKDPHVSVFVDHYSSGGASILGEVMRPGIYPVSGQERLFDLISAAGGLTEKAGRSISVVHRGQEDARSLPVSRNLSDNTEANIAVYPGDTVMVRKADIVYVVGDVGRPSGFLMDNGQLTVLQAIAMAGGTTKTAKMSAVRIIRKGPAGMSETPVQLKKILEAKAPDVTMQADDILFVPTSAEKIIAARTLEAAIQAATAVSIVAAYP